jgi:hypothetical protein
MDTSGSTLILVFIKKRNDYTVTHQPFWQPELHRLMGYKTKEETRI